MVDAVIPQAFIHDDIVIFGLIAGTLGLVFWTASRPGRWQKFYNVVPVSYTHLDVYKRQVLKCAIWPIWIAIRRPRCRRMGAFWCLPSAW